MATLGVTKSHSRPHVSNDNPFSESQFKTLKYRPDFPQRFACFDDGRALCDEFFHWYKPRAPSLGPRAADAGYGPTTARPRTSWPRAKPC